MKNENKSNKSNESHQYRYRSVRISSDVYKKIKILAARRDVTIIQFIEDMFHDFVKNHYTMDSKD